MPDYWPYTRTPQELFVIYLRQIDWKDCIEGLSFSPNFVF